MTFDWEEIVATFADTRGSKLVDYDTRTDITDLPGAVLLLNCDKWIADHVALCAEGECVSIKLAYDNGKKWRHSLHFPGGIFMSLINALDRLKDVLSIPAPYAVDAAIALDWYTQPDGNDEMARTTAGTWINHTKHATYLGSGAKQALREMGAALADFIANHPLYSRATAILTPPGHKADGQSFGERLGRALAKKVDIPFVEMTTPGGPRAEQKEAHGSLGDIFQADQPLSGTVIVFDDVYRTGQSVSAAARAARRAGADKVLVLTVARTIRR